MKITAFELKAMQRMQPGALTLNGFLGSDTRPLNEIIDDDAKVLARLHYSQEDVAARMEYFFKISWETFLGDELVDGKYEVQTDVFRGKLPCPYGHVGLYRKAITSVTNSTNGISVIWTPLNIHMIRDHGFFEGKGSAFRLEPDILVRAIFE
jgi:hypothetical protein